MAGIRKDAHPTVAHYQVWLDAKLKEQSEIQLNDDSPIELNSKTPSGMEPKSCLNEPSSFVTWLKNG